jgi:hypothetical protein
VLWLALANPARAQEHADASVTTPPQIVHLEPLQLAPDERARLKEQPEPLVLVDAAGHARLEGDEPSDAALRAAIEQALAHSEFKPALHDGQPISVRVKLRMVLPPAPPPPPEPPPPPAASPIAPQAAAVSGFHLREPDLSYGASGRVGALAPNEHRLQQEEMRNLPGAFGDPFRVIDALPGVVPALSGLPYVYVRGAPPAGTVYYYDDIQVPALFHLALGPAVVHPSLIDQVDFYPSVAPARFGRFTGGVLSGGPTPRPPPESANGELELRLIDIMGRVEVPVGGGSLTVAGRYGYPGPVVHLFSPQTTLAYWDYQTRLLLPLTDHDRFELVWFGSYDSAGFVDSRHHQSVFAFEFHRVEARLIRSIGRFELGSALQFGYEHSQIDTGLQVHATRLGPRVWASYRSQDGVRLRVGADVFGTVGDLYSPPNPDTGPISIRTPVADDVAARSVMGAYAELSVPMWTRLRLDLGLRGDLWLTGSRPEAAVDPRLTLTYRSHDFLTWHAAVGLAHQPAVFLVPLPGIADVGLDHGLQGAVQSEAGVAIDLPASLRLESQAYLQRFTHMIFPELAIDQTSDCAALPMMVADATSRCTGGYPRSAAWAYGAELFLRRASTEALSGWLSYTLGWARAQADDGRHFIPTFDVRHVLNLVLQWRIGAGFSVGGRVQYRSGKMASATFVRAAPVLYEQRLAGFFRADANVTYAWRPSWGRMQVSLEWFNLSLSREQTDIQCRDGIDVGANPLASTPCPVTTAPALFFPNIGVRAEFK